ncbi:MAG: phospholipid/cholesterol/gamma-HCH transport system substrate-binding protein, partial [Myxococcota bacterium]
MSSRKHQIGVGALFLVTLIIGAYGSVKLGAMPSFRSRISATVFFDDAAGVSKGSLVKVAGVEVGSVEDLSLIDGRAQLTLMINADAGVRSDVIAQVRSRSLLGEKFIALLPNPDPAPDVPLLTDGATLERSRPGIDVDDLLNRFGPLLDGLDGEALSGAFQAMTAALEADPERLTRMLADAEVILDNTAAASAALTPITKQTTETLASVRRAADAGNRTIRDLSSAAARADSIVAQAEDIAESTAALVSET